MARPRHPPHALGRFGEERAARYLERTGWRILERNYRYGRREVDLVARRGSLLAFVEVKTRSGSGYGPPEAAVTLLKRREIEAVALEYVSRRTNDDPGVRFDVISIVTAPGPEVARLDHLEDAWRPTSPR